MESIIEEQKDTGFKPRRINGNKFVGLLVFFVVCFEAIYDLNLLQNYSNLSIASLVSSSAIVMTGFSVLLKICPIIIITLHEIQSVRGRSVIQRLRQTSIWGVRNSGGYKYSDLYYFVLHSLQSKFLLFGTFLTLGLANFTDHIKVFLEPVITNAKRFSTDHFAMAVVVILAILLIDFSSYLKHYFSHKFPILWDLHEFHHSPTNMTIFSNYRNVPFSNTLQDLLVLPLTLLTWMLATVSYESNLLIPVSAFVFWHAFVLWTDIFNHSHTIIIFNQFWEHIFMSPGLHWIHHSSSEIHYDKNFGQRFSFWDRFFGTYYGYKGIDEIVSFGVIGTTYNKRRSPFATYIFTPFSKLLKRIYSC